MRRRKEWQPALAVSAVLIACGIGSVGNCGDQPRRFMVIEEPANDSTVVAAVSRMEGILESRTDIQGIPDRDKYVADFVSVLRRCRYQDRFRIGGEYRANDEGLLPEYRPLIELKMRTVARLIRCLGNLEAAEASETLAEFLTFPADIHVISPKIGPYEVPTRWAFVLIGEPALPTLHEKMLSNHGSAWTASFVAADILGPRACEELDRWVDEARPEDRGRLERHRETFRRVSSHYRSKSFEQYRKDLLRDGREYLKSRLKNPGITYPDDERKKHRTSRSDRLQHDQKPSIAAGVHILLVERQFDSRSIGSA